jgi:hypothetical protein
LSVCFISLTTSWEIYWHFKNRRTWLHIKKINKMLQEGCMFTFLQKRRRAHRVPLCLCEHLKKAKRKDLKITEMSQTIQFEWCERTWYELLGRNCSKQIKTLINNAYKMLGHLILVLASVLFNFVLNPSQLKMTGGSTW